MSITATELKQNLGNYLLLSTKEDARDCREALITDMKDYEKSKVRAILPDEFIKVISGNDGL